MKIKSINGKELFSSSETIKSVVENAVRNEADLGRANLFGANLSEADLTKAKGLI